MPGVSPGAEDCVVRAAYKTLCQHHHPDKAPAPEPEAAHARAAELNEAYSALGDEQKGKAYHARRPAKAPPRGMTVLGWERTRALPPGGMFESDWVHVFNVRNGKVTRVVGMYDTAASAAARL